jgi:hypothetical protein
MPENEKDAGPLFVQMPGSLHACAMKSEFVTYCGRELDHHGAAVAGNKIEVCAICRRSADADGVRLPKVTGYR